MKADRPCEIRAEKWLSGKGKTFLYKFIAPTAWVVGSAVSAGGLYRTYPFLISGDAERLPIWWFNPKVSIVGSFVFVVGMALVYLALTFWLARCRLLRQVSRG
jgi:hypothetical protein